jgi:hypothetical protein
MWNNPVCAHSFKPITVIHVYHYSVPWINHYSAELKLLVCFWQDEYQIIMMMNSYSHCFYEFHIASFLILLFELILSKKLIHDATTMGMMFNTTGWFLLSTFPVYHSLSFPKFLILVYLIARPVRRKKLKSMKKPNYPNIKKE